MITVTAKGDFSKTTKFIERIKEIAKISKLDSYGQEGVEALKRATPRDTGKTAESWGYRIIRKADSVSIIWTNTNINDGVPIAIILQYGHGTRNGRRVEGVDYINPALVPVFDKIANGVWKEVTSI